MMPRKIMRWIILVIVVCVSILGAYGIAKAGQFDFVAAPVKSDNITSIWAGPDAQGTPGKRVYLFTSPPHVESQLYLLRVEPDSGVVEPFYVGTPGSRPWATQIKSSDPNDGWLYGDWNTMAYRFSPVTGALQKMAEGGLAWDFQRGKVESRPTDPDLISAKVVTPNGKEYTLRSTASDTLWVREPTTPLVHLWQYDATAGVETDLGVVPTRKWWQYPQMTAGPNNKLYFSLAIAEPDIIVYNPATGTQSSMLPAQYKNLPAWTITALDASNVLYYFLYGGKPGLGPRQAFRVDDTVLTAVPNTQFPGYTGDDFPYTPANPPSTTLADGRVASFIRIKGSPGYYTYEDRKFNLSSPSTSTVQTFFDYSSTGVPLFGRLGKDPVSGKIYGTAPNHLFRYDPTTGKSEEVGTAPCYNQAYASIFTNGKFFTFSYGNGLMAIYDPTQPWNYGTAEVGTNPRDLGFVGGPGGNRFLDILVAPDGKIYTVSNPVNGYWGGSLVQINPVTYTSTYWWNTVIPNHTLQAMTVDPGQGGIWIGSSPLSVAAGDPDPTDIYAKLALWSLTTQQTIYTVDRPIKGMLAIESLVTANNKVYGLGRMGTYKGTRPYWGGGVMFVFDPATKQVVYQNTTYTPLIDISRTMELGTDGFIYAMVAEGLIKINPLDYSITLLRQWSYGNIKSGLLIDGGNIYFAIGSNLVKYIP